VTDSKSTTRREWGQKILDYLKNFEPSQTSELMKKLKVPKKEIRTFYRALGDLRSYGLIAGEDVPHLPGQKVEEIKATIGLRAVRLEIPVKAEVAKRLLNDRKLVRQIILTRKGMGYQLLKATGLLETPPEESSKSE